MYIEHPLIKPSAIEKRDYQVNISNSCIERSTLVVLPTGMGKTICALLVIAERLKKLPDKKILFLAPTKPLVEQHKAFINQFLLVDMDKTSIFTGEVNPKKRSEQWSNSQIIISTPQVIENDLLANRLTLEDVSFIIFDESHRAVGNYAYVFVAERYQNQGKDQLVMGITASPGSRAQKIIEVCNNLNISGVEIRSEYDPDVLPYVHDIHVQWLRVDVPDKIKSVIKHLQNILEEKCKALYKFGLVRRFRNISTTELLEVQKRIQARLASGKKQPHSLFFAATIQAAAIKINHAIMLAETQGPSALRNYLDRLEVESNSKGGSRAAKSLMKDKDLQRVIKLAENIKFDHPKLRSVVMVVQDQLAKKPDSRIIVFTHYRDTSKQVTDELSRLVHVRPARFVGQATHGKDKGLRQREQVALIEKFKAGEYNVLVATSVAEEGLDIPATDLVVFYEPIPSEIRTIQRRGRTGRKRPGKVIILITRNTRDEAYYWSSKNKEKQMKRELDVLRSKLAEKVQVTKPRVLERKFFTDQQIPAPVNQAASEVRGNNHSNNNDNNDNKNSIITIEKKPSKVEDNEQTRLGDFQAASSTMNLLAQKSNGNIEVMVDNREFKSLVVRELTKMNVTIIPKQLPFGDYIISERICVERKLVADFLQSLIDGRLFTQLKNMKNEYLRPVMILEGDGLFTSRRINTSAIYGALVSIISDFNIPIISTASARESAEMIRALALREQLEGRRVPSIRGEKGPMSVHERQQFIIESLPGVSATLALRLLEHFGSVSAVFQADPGSLTEVQGIGKKTAEEIKKVIDEKYAN